MQTTMDWLTTFSSIVVVLMGLFFTWRKKRSNLPPGPLGIPFLGNALSFGKRPAVTLTNWMKKYGDVYSLRVGPDLQVIIGNLETAKRVFSDDLVTGRPLNTLLYPSEKDVPSDSGLVRSNGELWKVHRRFSVSTLRDLGMGRIWMEDSIVLEVVELCRLLRESKQRPINPKPRIAMSIANVICAMTWGERFALDDPKFRRMTGLFSANVGAPFYAPLVQTFPFLMWFSNPASRAIKAFCKGKEDLVQFMKEIVAEFDGKSGHGMDDVLDYLTAFRREQESGAKTGAKSTFTEPQLIASMIDLFGAGTQTTATTIIWACVFMLENPLVLQKIQEEIDGNVGRNKMLRNEDRVKLPYTEATIMEVQRLGCLVPFSGRSNLEEIVIDGYTIPKDTFIRVNNYSIHRDPRYWENGEKFDPSRFLDSGNRLVKHEAFMPFSIGKRACPGESLAKMELFLFLANVFRCFTFGLPSGQPVTHNDYFAGNLHAPYPFEMTFVPREDTY